METNAKNIRPARATHPGSVLKSELQARDIKLQNFASVTGIDIYDLKELVKGRIPVNQAIASRLEQVLGIPAYIWSNLQNQYDEVVRSRTEPEKPGMHIPLGEAIPTKHSISISYI